MILLVELDGKLVLVPDGMQGLGDMGLDDTVRVQDDTVRAQDDTVG